MQGWVMVSTSQIGEHRDSMCDTLEREGVV